MEHSRRNAAIAEEVGEVQVGNEFVLFTESDGFGRPDVQHRMRVIRDRKGRSVFAGATLVQAVTMESFDAGYAAGMKVGRSLGARR